MTAPEDISSETFPLWRFALALYARPGVAQACLDLQDRREADVNLLLYAAWTGADLGFALTADAMAEARRAVADWHRDIVVPLRTVRRRLKTGPAPAPNEATDTLRKRVQAIEIEAERIEQSILQDLAVLRHPSGEHFAMTAEPAAARSRRMDTVAANLRLCLPESEPLDERDGNALATILRACFPDVTDAMQTAL